MKFSAEADIPIVPNEPRPKISCRSLWKIFGVNTESGQAALAPVELEKLATSLSQKIAIRDVDLDVIEGEIFVIMGLSGSGKSTVLRTLCRLVEPTSGEVLIDGVNIRNFGQLELIEFRRHKIGMVFQNFGLVPHFTVLENVAYPLRVQGVEKVDRWRKAQDVIDLVGLAGREKSYPRELSGGQQQRVGIARSLVVEPDIWLLDEPFSALDPLIRRQMQDEFLRLQSRLRKTIVFVTHDFSEALRIADRIAIMKDGRIVQIGTAAELFLHPVDSYIAEFTKEAPREKILSAGDIAEPKKDKRKAKRRIRSRAPVASVIALFEKSSDAVDVVDDKGKVNGTITPTRLLHVLFTELPGA